MEIVLHKVLETQMSLKKLTITELSKSTKIPRTTLIDWKDGRRPSSKNIHYLLVLSNFFGISLSELIFGTQEECNSDILFTSTFKDGKTKYKLTVERIDHVGGKNDK